MKADIRSKTREELESQFALWEQPGYRVGQLLEWLYSRRATSWDEMTNLPKALREKLRETYLLSCPESSERSSRCSGNFSMREISH